MGKSKINITFGIGIGSFLALGMAWHLDNGFWNIFLDTILGYIYVSYKLCQFFMGSFCH